MGKITFQIKSKIKGGKVDQSGKIELHMCFVVRSGYRLYAKSGIRVKADEWNNDAHKIIIPTKICDSQTKACRLELQKQLNELADYVQNNAISLEAEELTTEWLKQTINKYHNPAKCADIHSQGNSIFEALDKYIKDAPSRILKNGNTKSQATILQYVELEKSFRKYAETRGKKDFKIEELNKSLYDDYVNYLYNQGLKKNTAGKYIKNLKAVINSLPARIRTNCEFIDSNLCPTLKEDVYNIYLNEDELNAIDEYKITDPTYNNVRNQFLLLAWTGCRYSDLCKLTEENMSADKKYFKLKQKKTGNDVVIPILPQTQSILERCGNNMPIISNRTFNDIIRKICKQISEESVYFGDEVAITHVTNGTQTTERKKRYMMISAHTARRSFATNLYKRGFATLSIMQITGHKTEKSFLKYIKVSGEENAEMILNKATSSERSRAELIQLISSLDDEKVALLLQSLKK